LLAAPVGPAGAGPPSALARPLTYLHFQAKFLTNLTETAFSLHGAFWAAAKCAINAAAGKPTPPTRAVSVLGLQPHFVGLPFPALRTRILILWAKQ